MRADESADQQRLDAQKEVLMRPCGPLWGRFAAAVAAAACALGQTAAAVVDPPQDDPHTPTSEAPALGKIGRLKGSKLDAKAKGRPARQLAIGSLVIHESQRNAWKAQQPDAAIAGFPKEPSTYIIASFGEDPERRQQLIKIVKESGAAMLQEASEGLVVHADPESLKRIAVAGDLDLIDLIAPLTPVDKLHPLLKQRYAALETGAAPGPNIPKPLTDPGDAPAPEPSRPELEQKLRRPAQGLAAAPGAAVAEAERPLPVPDAGPPMARVIFYLFPGQPTEPVVARVRQFGEVLGAGRTENIGVVRARLPLVRVPAVAELPQVREVIPDAKPALRLNDQALKVMTENPPPFPLPLHGEDQVVGHADSGLDIGVNDATLHAAFRGRVKKAVALGRAATGDWSDYGGHGTHTAGSILGAGRFAGPASKALLVHQSIGDVEGGLGGIPDPLGKLFDQAYAEGARVHSDSWGTPISLYPSLAGQYLRGEEVDTWTWNGGQPRDMLIVIAAGNDGSLGLGSVGSPATAKNCLAVGASDNLRPSAGPLGADPSKLAPFSSLGPTKSGRRRPDVVAPGTWVVSAKTQAEHVAFRDDVEAGGGWAPDPAFTLSGDAALQGTKSWHIRHDAGETYRDFLVSPAFDLTTRVPHTVEVWMKGRVDPDQALLLAIRAGSSNAKLLEGDSVIGARQFADWTVVTAAIPESFLGKSGLRLLFVANQDSAASGPIDLFLDRVKITSFESWAPLSRIGLASPLVGDDILYTLEGGTSMATPLVAGSAAVVRQSLIARGTPQPRAELVKAVLINTAQAHSGPRPNNNAGWGRIDLKRALTASFVIDNDESLAEGQSITYKIAVTDQAQELRATLAWADPPGDLLQNNLDMVLIDPAGQVLRPVDAQNHSPDSQNNVEGIDAAQPKAGDWTLVITATSLAKGPQPYALIVSGVVTAQ